MSFSDLPQVSHGIGQHRTCAALVRSLKVEQERKQGERRL
jgi:hypothetical protein